ncbi:hypothetical protein N7478_002802 [Penicillium angulare]|uniref:uncharacterized protein n=1 Tax=Penicillium angulare TaxID=116970 RepID=UPI0025414CFA|nr:uncharacterized protein N7478_002802 [Penicillium angulare]KAJ5287116.1 hypothetical protein N7478_002802 [Penicillium angulare]
MAHSKRNTSLPHFTSYERSLLRNSWGTKRSVIGRDSFLPFASCKLCLQPARTPVSCANNGDLFCRECAINDLLAQRQEIKRLERERDDAKKRIAEDDMRVQEQAKKDEVANFELVSMGLEGERKERLIMIMMGEGHVKENAIDNGNGNGKRVKGDEPKSALPSFWVPSLTPSTDANEIAASKTVKLAPVCPGSSETQTHSYSLKGLVEVHFTEEKATDGSVSRICPSCKKNLSNGLKAMLTKPCGHVICSPCVSKFMTPNDTPDPHASKEEQEAHSRILCYVCETDLTEVGEKEKDGKKKSKKKDKEGIKPGLVAISSEGTGFAGGGGNVGTKSGVAFQC